MRCSSYIAALFGATTALAVTVSKVERSYDPVVVRRAVGPVAPPNEAMAIKDTDAAFSLDKEFTNQTLYRGRVGTGTGNVDLDIKCVKCKTNGTVTATLTDHEIVKPHVRLNFQGVTAYVETHVTAKGLVIYPINLFTSESPVGIGTEMFNIGVMFFVDLVFSLTDSLDFEGGFTVTIPDDATVDMDIFSGDIDSSNFDGASSSSLPVTVNVGNAKFTADLRLRLQAGIESKTPIGGGAVVAIYANLAEFSAELASSDACKVEVHEWVDINCGAFASAGATAEYLTMSKAPTASTTYWTSPTDTQCLDDLVSSVVTPAPALPTGPAWNVSRSM